MNSKVNTLLEINISRPYKMNLRQLFERKIDPVNLAQRVGKKYGQEKDYGYYKSGTEPGKYIPLKNFNDDLVDEMEKAKHNLYKLMGYSQEKNNLKPIILKLQSQFGSNQTLMINKLLATQPFVRIEDIETLKQKVSSSKQISVSKYLGKYFIVDGHHATLAARLRGENSIEAHVVDLDSALKQIKQILY